MSEQGDNQCNVVKSNPDTVSISIVVPVFNEEESLSMLYRRLTEVLSHLPTPYCQFYELVLVDDGSTDRSFVVARELRCNDPRIKVVRFRRNFGKTAALRAGFDLSRGERVITIDADLQEDPVVIKEMLDKIDCEEYDLVSGWRKRRNDPLSKTLPSLFFNFVVSQLTGIRLHDFNCGFKAYRREVVNTLKLYGDLHRFIPVLAHQQGFRVVEIPVEHCPRRYGKSKFGATRMLHGYLDFIQVLFLTTYLRRPLRLFGTVGTAFFGLGFLIGLYMTWLWFNNIPIGTRPLLTLAVLLMITGFQFISTGLIGEMLRNISFEDDDYAIREVLGISMAYGEKD